MGSICKTGISRGTRSHVFRTWSFGHNPNAARGNRTRSWLCIQRGSATLSNIDATVLRGRRCTLCHPSTRTVLSRQTWSSTTLTSDISYTGCSWCYATFVCHYQLTVLSLATRKQMLNGSATEYYSNSSVTHQMSLINFELFSVQCIILLNKYFIHI